MKSGYLSFLFLLLILCSLFSSGLAQENQIKIAYSIDADNLIEEEVESYLTRELRDIGDVKIVEDEAIRHIKIIVSELNLGESQSVGYSVSVLVENTVAPLAYLVKFTNATERISKNENLDMYKELEENGYGALIDDFLKTVEVDYFGQFGNKDLKNSIESVVAAIDVNVFKEIRRKF